MNIQPILKQLTPIIILGTLLTACGSGGGSDNGYGSLTLKVTDAPVDMADHVYVQFHGLEIQGTGMHTTLYYCEDPGDATKTIVSPDACTTPSAPKQIDLMTLTGGQADFLLDGYKLPAGHYSWIRLMVDTAGTLDSYIVVSGGNYELTIPSGSETGLKLNRGFTVPAGGTADFTIDFDLRKSVHMAGMGDYLLRPTLRMVNNILVGSIAGTVDAALVTSGCTPAVYVYSGTGVTPDDIDGIAPDPVTTAAVKLDNGSGQYVYKAAFLEAGDYTVAYTCQAAADDPATNDSLAFTGTTNVAVTANAVTTKNFP